MLLRIEGETDEDRADEHRLCNIGGHQSDGLIREAAILAWKLALPNPPVECIHYERGEDYSTPRPGVIEVGGVEQQFGDGPHMMQSQHYQRRPEVAIVYGYRFHDPASDEQDEVEAVVFTDDAAAKDQDFSAERAVAVKYLQRWMRYLENAQAPSTLKVAGQQAGSVATPDLGQQAEPPSKGLATSKDLAREWGVDEEATRKALDRWREKRAGGDGFIEDQDRRPNEPAFRYDRAYVRHVMEGLRDRQTRREIRRTKVSGKRPAG